MPKRVWQGVPPQLHPRWMWEPTCIPLHAHGEAIRSMAFPSLYGRDRTTLPQLLIHPHGVNHTLCGRVVASTNQSGPPDWCLLRLDHVGYGWLHVDGLTFVVRWTCHNHTETGRPLNGCLPHVHCRGMQWGSDIHLECNCRGTPCQTRLGVVPPVQHVRLEPRLEGSTWFTNPGVVNRCAKLGASGWLSFVSWTAPGTLQPAGHSWRDVRGHLWEGAGARRGQPWGSSWHIWLCHPGLPEVAFSVGLVSQPAWLLVRPLAGQMSLNDSPRTPNETAPLGLWWLGQLCSTPPH